MQTIESKCQNPTVIRNIKSYLTAKDAKNSKALKAVKDRYEYLSKKYKRDISNGDIAIIELIDDNYKPLRAPKLLGLFLTGDTHISYVELFNKDNLKPTKIFQSYDLKNIQESIGYQIINEALAPREQRFARKIIGIIDRKIKQGQSSGQIKTINGTMRWKSDGGKILMSVPDAVNARINAGGRFLKKFNPEAVF